MHRTAAVLCTAANGSLVPGSGIIRTRCERPSRPAAPELRWDAEPGKLAGLARQGQDLTAASRGGRLAARRMGRSGPPSAKKFDSVTRIFYNLLFFRAASATTSRPAPGRAG